MEHPTPDTNQKNDRFTILRATLRSLVIAFGAVALILHGTMEGVVKDLVVIMIVLLCIDAIPFHSLSWKIFLRRAAKSILIPIVIVIVAVLLAWWMFGRGTYNL